MHIVNRIDHWLSRVVFDLYIRFELAKKLWRGYQIDRANKAKRKPAKPPHPRRVQSTLSNVTTQDSSQSPSPHRNENAQH